MTTEIGWKRDTDGVLYWAGGGAVYKMPDEAIKTWWAGKLKPSCNESVFSMYYSSACGKTPKFDPDKNGRPTKCGHHSAAAKARKKAKQEAADARWRAERAKQDAIYAATKALEPALRRIAEGHNDPRTFATEVLDALDKARAMPIPPK